MISAQYKIVYHCEKNKNGIIIPTSSYVYIYHYKRIIKVAVRTKC